MATKPPLEAFLLASFEVEKQGANPELVDQVQTLQISGDKAVQIGSELELDVKDNICKVLTQHSDSFASKATEIVGVDPQISSHSLNIQPGMKPVVQKKEVCLRKIEANCWRDKKTTGRKFYPESNTRNG